VSQIGGTGRRGDAPPLNSSALDEANGPGARETAGPALAAVGVSKRFGVVQALDDVTLSVRPSEILALVGENGAGKSTLVRIFEGVYRPDQGALKIGGAPQAFRSPSDAHALGIRVIHQEPDIVPDLSIAENLFLGDFRSIHGMFLDRGDLERRTHEMLAKFGLEKDLGPWIRAGDLGPSQRQLMEIMRALRGGLRVLALDEPTSSLTEEEAQRLFRVVRRLRDDDGVGVIYISHRMREVRDLADRVAVLRDGRLVAERPTAEFPEAEIIQAMVGRPIADLYERGARRRGEAALSVRGLTTKRVSDVNFDVHSGEVVGLAGLVGAGRSELAEAIFGHVRMLAGSVAVRGRPIRLKSPADAIAAGIGFAPEDRKSQALLLMRSVKANISLAVPDLISRFDFVDPGAEQRIAAEFADRLRIRTPSLEAAVSNLSGGNQQKVVLGRWLARHPKVLILDEPTKGIDVGAKAEIYRLIAELAGEGIALLVISSEMPELLGMADRILVMAGGRIVADLDHEAANEERILSLAMADNLTRTETAAAP
jgi:L-arabinose transport system ATP-binding protein